MECNLYKTKPCSSRGFLRQQVDEQASVCDVKVKVGLWEKMFHWCVLISSPFFNSIYQNEFLERSTDVVHIKFVSQNVVESAIMFLYGKKPNITMENISEMFDIAEFFLLPNLKSICVSWIKRLKITLDNCMGIVRICSLYDIYMPDCEQFIKGHLFTLMELDEMLNLTKDSVRELFTDPTLSYVTVDRQYRFLKRWVLQRESRLNDFNDLFYLLHLTDTSHVLLEEMKADPLVKRAIDASDPFFSLPDSPVPEDETRKVLISYSHQHSSLVCLDIEKSQWFRINNDRTESYSPALKLPIKGTKGRDFPELYRVDKTYSKCDVYVMNLADETCRKTSLCSYDNCSEPFKDFDQYVISNNIFVAYKQSSVRVRDKHTGKEVKRSCIPYSTLYYNDYFSETSREVVTTLFVGTLFNGPDGSTTVKPVLCLKTKLIKIAVDNEGNIALLSGTRKMLYIYNTENCTLDNVNIQPDPVPISHNDKLLPCDNGFVIYDERRVLCVTSAEESQNLNDYHVQIKAIEKKGNFRLLQYRLIGNKWFRLCRKNYDDDYELSCTPHDKYICQPRDKFMFEELGDIEMNVWTTLSLTNECKRSLNEFINDETHMISLPKQKLQCHLNCPHCDALHKAAKKKDVVYYQIDSDDDFFNYYSDYYDPYDYYYDSSD